MEPGASRAINLNSVLELELTCPICYHLCIPPITQCCNGHNICSACRPKINKCGLCKGSLTSIRNIFAEKVSDYLRVTQRTGQCTEIVHHKSMPDHEDKGLLTIPCHFVVNRGLTDDNPMGFISLCSWHGRSVMELLAHAKNDHPEGLLAVNPSFCEVDLNGLSCQTFLVVAHHEVFWVFFSKCKYSLHGTVEGVGWPNNKVLEYDYWFELRAMDRTENVMRRGTVLPCRRLNQVLNFFTSGVYTLLVEGQELRKFVHKNQVVVRVFIERNVPLRSAIAKRTNTICKI